MTEHSLFEEAVLEYLFGDDARDPALLVTMAAENDALRARLDSIGAELEALRAAHGLTPDTGCHSQARLSALRAAVEARMVRVATKAVAVGAATATSRGSTEPGVRQSERSRAAPARSLRAPRPRRARLMAVAATLAAATAMVVLWPHGGTGPRDETGPHHETRPPIAARAQAITVAEARRRADEVGEGLGFAGETLSPEDRGRLLGVIADLAVAPNQSAPAVRNTLQAITARALSGLPDVKPAEAAIQVARAGCGALYKAPSAKREACERGVAAYREARDATTRGVEALPPPPTAR